MNKLGFLLLGIATGITVLAVGCGDDNTNTGTTSNTSSSSSSSGESSSSSSSSGAGGSMDHGMMPTYGAQMDRFGRPAINTALNHVFDPDMASQGAAKDAWNANADDKTWSQYVPDIQKNLAILDSLDTVCGNQLLADKNKNDATRYAPLAGALSDDRQWLNTDGKACTQYLAVELAANGNPNAGMDCGGRALNYDPIDVSYSGLAVGMLSGVSDGIATPSHAQGKAFPYLAAPVGK